MSHLYIGITIGAIYGVFALALGSAVGRMLRDARRQTEEV
jgi:hypothetical protein